MSSTKAEHVIVHKIIDNVIANAIKAGLISNGVPEHVANGIKMQFSAAYDLVQNGHKLTPAKLTLISIDKIVGAAGMANDNARYQCGVAIIIVATAIAKTGVGVAATAGSGGLAAGPTIVAAADLVLSTADMDKACGISAKAQKEFEARAIPFFTRLENEIRRLYRVPQF